MLNRINENQENLPERFFKLKKMLETSRYDFCTYIKDFPEYVKIPIIFISTLVSPRDLERRFQCGAMIFIKNP